MANSLFSASLANALANDKALDLISTSLFAVIGCVSVKGVCLRIRARLLAVTFTADKSP